MKVARWTMLIDADMARHVLPVADLIDHELSEHCVCGPLSGLYPQPGQPDLHTFRHWSLDGRENR